MTAGNNPQATVFGTIFVDCKGFAFETYLPTGRNPGRVEFVHGGVGRNVAENLARLGIAARFSSTCDDSPLGRDVLDRLQRLAVDTSPMQITQQHGIGMWLAILDEKGDLAGSISHMPDMTLLDRALEREGASMLADGPVLVELDLTESIAERIIAAAEERSVPVFALPGNLSIARKRPDLLAKLDLFICNDIEAGGLWQTQLRHADTERMIADIRKIARETGIRQLVVTLGEHGSVYCDTAADAAGYQPAEQVRLVDSSGAGDAFFSGTSAALIRGLPLAQAVVCGTKTAAWTIQSEQNNCADLAERMAQDEWFRTHYR